MKMMKIFAHTHNISIDDVRLTINIYLKKCKSHDVAPGRLLLSTCVSNCLYPKIRKPINVTLIIIDKLQMSLETDVLQFGFKKKNIHVV